MTSREHQMRVGGPPGSPTLVFSSLCSRTGTFPLFPSSFVQSDSNAGPTASCVFFRAVLEECTREKYHVKRNPGWGSRPGGSAADKDRCLVSRLRVLRRR